MKYYTLPEHRTFCIESGIPNVEVWREVVKLGWLPEGIYHAPDIAFNPKRKEYRLTPEFKARKKKYRSTPEYKAKQKEYRNRYRRNKK